MGAARPTSGGGAIAVTDSDALAALSSAGLPPGTTVWNADVGSFFKLTISNEALDPDVVIEVAGIDGYRWILSAGGSSGGLGWYGECSSRAVELLGSANIADVYWTNMADGAFTKSGAASQIAGGRYQIGNGGTGEIDLGITVSSAGQQLLTAVGVQDWYAAGRFNFPTPAFDDTPDVFSMPLGFFVEETYEFYIIGEGGSDRDDAATEFYLQLHNGIDEVFQGLGPVATLGASTCPIGPDAWTIIEIVRKSAQLDVYFNRVLARSFTGSELDTMPGGPGYLFSFGDDATMAFRIGGLYLARGPI